jgi:hypothetical protein
MFGLEKISWTQFLLFLFYAAAIWYGALLALAWIKGQTGNRKTLFEYDDEGETPKEKLIPVTVSAADFPREMVSLASREDEDLITNLYEENGIEDGYPLEQFSETDLNELPQILENIQVQK